MGLLDFSFVDGAIHFPELRLWLDAHKAIGPDELVFVSHAHSDHTARHARVVLTPATRALMRARVSGQREEQEVEFGRRVALATYPDVYLTLLPAGHILGSAMILLEAGGESLLYTGDFKLRQGLSAETCLPCRAERLIMESTFGRPKYVFPAADEVLKSVIQFCREALSRNETPILLGYSLGKSQEILSSLAEAGLPVQLHRQVAKMTDVYRQYGKSFPEYPIFEGMLAPGHVVMMPPGPGLNALRRDNPALRVAVLTGWALDSGCKYRYRCDAAFALSDHADYPELIDFVRRVQPREVYTLHGFAADFATSLRRLGFSARALGEDEQLELDFDLLSRG